MWCAQRVGKRCTQLGLSSHCELVPAHHWKDLKHWFSCHIFPFCMQTSGDNVLTTGCGNFRPSAQLMGAAMRSREACVQALTPDSKAVTCFLYVQRNLGAEGMSVEKLALISLFGFQGSIIFFYEDYRLALLWCQQAFMMAGAGMRIWVWNEHCCFLPGCKGLHWTPGISLAHTHMLFCLRNQRRWPHPHTGMNGWWGLSPEAWGDFNLLM